MRDPDPHLRSAAACIAVAAALAACASSSGGDAAGPDADRRFYEGRCGVCHVPFHKSDFAPRKWPAIVEFMGPRAGLTKSQRERILSYLTAAEPAPVEAGGGTR